MVKDQAERLASLEVLLKDRIHGQEPALSSIAQALKVAHAGLGDPNRPLGVMLLAGPTGTGKSQTAQALADLLFGGKGHLIHFNMNEFQEAHTVSTLKGAPPGYVGYGKGGRLTEALRKQPYAVLLLDEFDRAHPDVHEIFYQAFDQGWMEDAEGRHINLRNCLVLMTSNVGDAQIAAAVQAEADISQGRLNKMALEQLQKTFAPALLARMQVVAYRPLGQTALAGIAHQSLNDIEWLMGLRSRSGIPGGTCEFDLPAYHAWRHFEVSRRRADLMHWMSSLMPLAEAAAMLLKLLRDEVDALTRRARFLAAGATAIGPLVLVQHLKTKSRWYNMQIGRAHV
jgi:ATP-dependent Clp protease ATP-binding subunit ClpA